MTTLDGRTEPRRGPRAWATRLTGATGQFGALLRHAPLTVAVTALIWIVGAATGSLRAGPSARCCGSSAPAPAHSRPVDGGPRSAPRCGAPTSPGIWSRPCCC